MIGVWARRGTRPIVDKQTRYENVYLFGAACPTTGDSHALLLPYANIPAMQSYLDSLSDHVGAGRHVVLVLDGAGWHSSPKINVPPNISLLPLPPYSPELNPAENIWGYMKQHYLSNRTFEDYDALLEAGQAAWNALTPDLIQSLCRRSWIS